MAAVSQTRTRPPIDPDAPLGAGVLDRAHLPDADGIRRLYRAVAMTRALDVRIGALYRQGRITGSFYSGMGNEGVAVGAAWALARQDVLVPTHRDLGAHLVRGHGPRDVLLQFFRRRTSQTQGRDVGLHLGAPGSNIVAMVSHIGHMLPVAAGIALADGLLGRQSVVLTTIGDGGTSIGDFHEALNLAAVQKLPLVVVIENNQYAYSTPTNLQYACERLSDRAIGYGIAGEQVDGTDVLAVFDATRRAVERARAGGGPTLLETLTMRMKGHSEHDDARYVPEETLESWRAFDPLVRLERHVDKTGILSAIDRAAVAAAIEEEIEQAVVFAEAEPPADPADAKDRVYAHWEASWRPRR